MTKEEALQFLREHQPLPPDDDLDRDIIKKYDEVRRFFLQNPSSECIPLLLGSFGEGSGLGVYQMIEDVISKHDIVDVVPYIIENLKSETPSIRSWNAEIAAGFPSVELIEPLGNLLNIDDHDLKYATITALEQIDDPRANDVLREALVTESDEVIRQLLIDALDS